MVGWPATQPKENELLPYSYSCPRCKCHALCRLRRKGMDRIFSFFGLRPVRCLTYLRKSYMRIEEKDLALLDRLNTPASAPLARVAPVQAETRTTSRHAA